MARFTCLDMLLCSFLDFGTGWIIAAMWPLDCMYPPLPKLGCPWFVTPPWLDSSGGGGASYATEPGAPVYP
jgi:hypothetical protein